MGEIPAASLCDDRQPRWDRQTKRSHFSQIGALAAQDRDICSTPFGFSPAEAIDPLLHPLSSTPSIFCFLFSQAFTGTQSAWKPGASKMMLQCNKIETFLPVNADVKCGSGALLLIRIALEHNFCRTDFS